MQRLPSALILTCLAFINFPQGCYATKCTLTERQKCHKEFSKIHYNKISNSAHLCSAAKEYEICVSAILDDCKANPHVADIGLIASQAKHTQKQMKDIREKHRCGACEKKHSLVAITLGLLYYFLSQKS